MKNEWFYKRMYGNLKALLVFSKNFPLSKISRVFLENPFEVVCPSQDFIVDPCNSDLIFGKYKDSVTCSSPHDVPNFSLLQTKSFIWIIFTQSRIPALIFKHLCFNKNKQKTYSLKRSMDHNQIWFEQEAKRSLNLAPLQWERHLAFFKVAS